MGIDVVNLDGWNIMFHRVPYAPRTIGYFPKGPMPDTGMIRKLTALGKQKRAIFIQIEPNATSGNKLLPPSHHPLFTKYTFVLDLGKSEEQLLAAMHPKTRYNIRLAQKHGVKIKEDNSAFKTFLELNRETLHRQGFYAHNDHYYQLLWQHLHPNIARLFTATYKNQILAAWIIFAWGEAIYYPYGASSREHSDVMAPTLLLWEIARWAKKKGYKKFDLWGALGPNPNPKDPWFGFHRFKSGFGPDLVEFVGSFDLVLKPMLYRLYTLADTVRWMYLRSRR